jgi:hypothetical protein
MGLAKDFLYKKITLKEHPNLTDYFIGAISTIIALYVLFPISKDYKEYSAMYAHIYQHTDIEYIFRLWLNFGYSYQVSLQALLLPLIFLSILMKLKVIKQVDTNSHYAYFAYFAIFYLLHDCTQIRVSIALAFGLWSCVNFTRNQWVNALLSALTAIGFQITSILLPATFLVCYFSKTARNVAWYVLLLGFLVYLLRVPIMQPITMKLTHFMGGIIFFIRGNF